MREENLRKTWPRISQAGQNSPGDFREITIYTGESPPENSNDRVIITPAKICRIHKKKILKSGELEEFWL
jgi:hypothetical protein